MNRVSENVLYVIAEFKKLRKEILDAMEYGSDSDDVIDDCYIDDKWCIYEEGPELWVKWNEKDEQMECAYTISSLGARGEKLFMYSDKTFTYVMGYPLDEDWDDTAIFILRNENKIEYTEDVINF